MKIVLAAFNSGLLIARGILGGIKGLIIRAT